MEKAYDFLKLIEKKDYNEIKESCSDKNLTSDDFSFRKDIENGFQLINKYGIPKKDKVIFIDDYSEFHSKAIFVFGDCDLKNYDDCPYIEVVIHKNSNDKPILTYLINYYDLSDMKPIKLKDVELK